MYLQYYLFFNSDVYTSELATQPPASVFERKWNASAAEKNKMMTWCGKGKGLIQNSTDSFKFRFKQTSV